MLFGQRFRQIILFLSIALERICHWRFVCHWRPSVWTRNWCCNSSRKGILWMRHNFVLVEVFIPSWRFSCCSTWAYARSRAWAITMTSWNRSFSTSFWRACFCFCLFDFILQHGGFCNQLCFLGSFLSSRRNRWSPRGSSIRWFGDGGSLLELFF